tara:strand:- start:5291 stop:6607 length:1317 start_codon:yes stop_codon:yes gene_type:complete
MKRIFYILTLAPFILSAQVVIEDFEDNRHLSYVEKSGEFVTDNPTLAPALMGGMYFGIENPDMTGINTSLRCGSYMRNAVETYDYFIALPAGGFTNLDDFTSGENFFTLDVWSPEESTSFIISFENREIAQINSDSLDGVHSRFEAFTSVANAWQTITFSFLDFPDLNISEDQIDQMVMLVNSGQENNAVTIYFDNFIGPDFGCDGINPNNVIEDFECQRNIEYTFTHGALSYVTNPQQSGINNSEKVGFYESLGIGDENNNDVTILTFDEQINISQNNRISIKVKSNFIKMLQLTLQGEGNSYTKELELDGSDTWKEYVFNFSDILDNSIAITQALLIFAPGETDFGYNFYYDDLSLIEVSNLDQNINDENVKLIDNFIYFSDYNLNKSIEIYDLSGRLLQKDLTSKSSLRINHYGLLFINILYENGEQKIFKYLNK